MNPPTVVPHRPRNASWSSRRVLELTAVYWQQTLEDPEVQRRLESNIFRRILLADNAELTKSATAVA